MFALIDCNNFYASCERLFRPDLRNKPIVVLSNNDGCVIARSNEAKVLGIKMGEPFFQIKHLVKQNKVQVFSSNYTLYGDLSQRVMSIIEEAWPHVEIYSIDEAFLDLSTLPLHLHDAFCEKLQKRILRCTGIPTSIGIGPTKTLAKLANHVCKKKLKITVFNITEQKDWLNNIEVADIWGIGKQWTKKLMQIGANTAADLAKLNPHLIRKKFNVVIMRTILELQGFSCLSLDVIEPKQSITSSRSFGQMQTQYEKIAQAISNHCARACEKARAQQLNARRLTVFVRSNPFRQDLKQYTQSITVSLAHPTNDTRDITHIAKKALMKIFKPNIFYKKAGIILEELVGQEFVQGDLFDPIDEVALRKKEEAMRIFDKINKKYGNHTIKLAAEGYSKTWKMRAELRSPCYTTRWTELAVVK